MKPTVLLLLTSLSYLFGQVNVAVSIIPQKTFVQKIGADKVNIMTVVQPGQSPHTYEPKPSQMQELSKAQVYFPIEIDFENVWLDKFASQNKTMKIVPMTKGVQFITMKKHKQLQGEQKTIIKPDPHTWISPLNVKIMAKTIYETLSLVDTQNKEFYKKNYLQFLDEINDVDNQINKILVDVPNNAKFMVFHPAWGYFARDYGLIQFPVEKEGKEPSPKVMMKIIKKAREENIKAIIVQKEFSTKAATALANELNIKVIQESPLAKNWGENLIKMAKTVANYN